MNKPTTKEEWDAWCREWDGATHQGKLSIASVYGISYDSARHWRSDAPIPVLQRNSNTEERPMRIAVDEILELRPATNLDFVSFDIETSNLKADFSILLSAVIKPFGQESIVFRADSYDTWAKDNRADDSQITKDIADELSRHAIVITHYGTKFDIPYMRAKMVYHGMAPLPPMFAVDTFMIAKRNFQVSSRRLKNLASYFDIGDKEGVEGRLWVEAAYNGNKEALDEIVKHNIIDCEVLEKLGCLGFAYLKSIPKL